jgi:hypothetical protein
MRSRMGIAACVATAVWLLGVGFASAQSVLFDSLGGANSGAADTSIDPIMSATFKTGASPRHVAVALSLFAVAPDEGGDYRINLDGGIPLSDLAFDPINGLEHLEGSSVDFQGPVLGSVMFPVASLPTAPSVEHYDQFSGVALNPNSLYWIEVRVDGGAIVEWGITDDVSGPGVSGNYLAWSGTDDGFFLNDGVQPFAFDQALKMRVSDAVPEPSTWAMMLLGFAVVGYAGYRRARGPRVA